MYTGRQSSIVWTFRAMVEYLENVSGNDITIERTRNGYTVRDTYRPEMVWEGKNPKEAVLQAIPYLPKNALGY